MAKSLRTKRQYLIEASAGWLSRQFGKISGALEREGDISAFRTEVLISVTLIVNRDYVRTQHAEKTPAVKRIRSFTAARLLPLCVMHLLSVVSFNVFANSISNIKKKNYSYIKLILPFLGKYNV